MKNKRIALIFSGDFPEGNTKNARLKSLATVLSEQEWDVEFVSVYPSQFSKRAGFKQMHKWEGYKVKRLALGTTYWSPKFIRILQIASGILRLLFFSTFSSYKYDVLYFYCPRFSDSLLGLIICSVLGSRIVVDQTELFSLKGKRHEKEEQIIAKRSHLIFAISDVIYEHFQFLNPKAKLLNLPIMVDLSRFETEREEIPKLIGYIGSFAKKDGVDFIVHSFAEAVKELPALRLRLIGYNRDVLNYKALVKELGIEDKVDLTGRVAYKEIPWLLQECDTLILNRRKWKFSEAGYPIKLGEYFACQKPVLMSDIGGFSRYFSHRNEVYKYEAENEESLKNTILYRYKNVGESDAVAKRGREYAEDHFSTNKNGLFFANAIDELV